MSERDKPHRRIVLAGLSALAGGATAGQALAAPRAQVAARLSGPIAGGPVFTGGPDAAEALRSNGYVQEEYFVSGQVRGRPYKTTLLVRRPADVKRFSGLVVVEPVHVGGGSQLWPYGGELFMDGGHGFALVGAQRIPLLQTIRPINPARYADLVLPQATAGEIEREPLAGVLATAPPTLAAQLRASEAEAPLAHEVMSQVGALLKARATRGPFPAGRVRRLVTGGYSQTGSLTLKYIRGSARTAKLADGSPVYDGFMPLGSCGDRPSPPHPGKVIHALGEGDHLNFTSSQGAAYRRADSDVPGDQYRLYEIPGGSHISTRGPMSAEARENYGPDEHPSQFPSRMMYRGAITNLLAWVQEGKPPPRAARIELDAAGKIVRDAHGNARGGVRTSYLDVPSARYIAVAPPRPGGFDRNFYGLEVPFPKAELLRLYPTHADYLAKTGAKLEALVREGWMLAADAEVLKREAEQAAAP